ncbi:MAG: hypothetical protein OEM52_04265 [bacterium]|nr:hypothetical protein [bacterium]
MSSKSRNLLLLVFIAIAAACHAYPEFQAQIQKNSGTPVNCAFCHSNSNGPEGASPGQIGALNPTELEKLNRARMAFTPGQKVDSPILNPFGNAIIGKLGRTKFIELRRTPEKLSGLLDPLSDIDHDGSTDVEELANGTHPVNPHSGNPWSLFTHNLWENRFHVFMIILATLFVMYGIRQLINGFAALLAANRK